MVYRLMFPRDSRGLTRLLRCSRIDMVSTFKGERMNPFSANLIWLQMTTTFGSSWTEWTSLASTTAATNLVWPFSRLQRAFRGSSQSCDTNQQPEYFTKSHNTSLRKLALRTFLLSC